MPTLAWSRGRRRAARWHPSTQAQSSAWLAPALDGTGSGFHGSIVVALTCLAHFGFDDHGRVHQVTGALLIAVFAFKIAVIRWWHGLGRLLPLLGTCVFVLLALTWLTSAGHFLGGGE